MKTRPLVLQIAAVVCSLTLAGLFVYDRALGGTGWFLPRSAPNPPAAAPASTEPGESLTKTGAGTMLLSGSKSYTGSTIIVAGELQANSAPETNAEPSTAAPAPSAATAADLIAERTSGLAGTLPRQQTGATAVEKSPAEPPPPSLTSQEEAPPRREVLLPGSKAPLVPLFDGTQTLQIDP